MADLLLHTKGGAAFTCVDNNFIDVYMKDANGEFVKIYLYLLRCLSQKDPDMDISHIADKLDHTEKDVIRALEYWQKQGLLSLEYSGKELVGICLLQSTAPDVSFSTLSDVTTYKKPDVVVTNEVAPVSPEPPKPVTPPKPASYSAMETERITSEEGVAELLYMAEAYLHRTLTITDTHTILYWVDSLKMPIDLIEYLIESCVEKNHSSLYYMNSIAISWHENGISSVEDAKSESKNHTAKLRSVLKAFGISGRELIPDEMQCVTKWQELYGMSDEMIQDAARRTVYATGKASIRYADSILTNWYEKGIHTVEAAKQADQEFINTSAKNINASLTGTKKSSGDFGNFTQRDYDFSDLEAKWMNKK